MSKNAVDVSPIAEPFLEYIATKVTIWLVNFLFYVNGIILNEHVQWIVSSTEFRQISEQQLPKLNRRTLPTMIRIIKDSRRNKQGTRSGTVRRDGLGARRAPVKIRRVNRHDTVLGSEASSNVDRGFPLFEVPPPTEQAIHGEGGVNGRTRG